MTNHALYEASLTEHQARFVGNFLIGWLNQSILDGAPVDPREALDAAADAAEVDAP